jgi:hypothetical protein
MNEQIITSFNNYDTSQNANENEAAHKLQSNNSERSSRNSMNSAKLKEVASITTNLIIQNAIQGAIDR